MKPIQAIIADDEAPLRGYLRARLAEVWPELEVCGEAENGRQAVELIRSLEPDIAFLDIKMPGLSGIEVARECAGACRVVFITAYDRFAVEAFEQEAMDYLLKPVTPERLEKTVHRLRKSLSRAHDTGQNAQGVLDRVLEALQVRTGKNLQWIKVQHGDGIRLIHVDDVHYFQAEDKYTRVVTRSGESLIRKPIKELADELDPDRFWRVHRSVIVNVSQIAKTSRSLTGRYSIKLKDRPEILTVSRTYAHLFRQM